MASPRTSAPGRLRAGRVALITTIGVLGIAFAPLPALATPAEPVTPEQAAELVAQRGHDLEVVTEQFNTARETLTAQQAAAATAATEVTAAQAALAEARSHVTDIARSAFTGSGLSSVEAMLTSTDASQLIDRVGTLETIADHNNSILTTAQTANDAAAEAEQAASDATAAAQTQVDQVAAQQADLQTQIAAYQADYDRLSAEQRAAAAAAAATSSVAGPSSGSTSSSPSTGSSDVASSDVPESVVASSGVAATVVDTAMAQLGDPYVWAASGPGSFDCSGLAQYAYAAAGISLPHSSSLQSTMGEAVSRSQLQPGDLVFFYSPVSHVGIYVGNGLMVHAPTSGDVVKVASIDAMGSITAMRRIG